MVTPLYKSLKENGTSFYAFPGAAEDISAAYQNSNYKMYFSKYTLLDFPKQNLESLGGTQASNIYWNFASFSSLNVVQPESYGDKVVESLRNYVANHEVTIRESRLNNTQYYYDNTALETTSEKIFFKWCKKLGLISLEQALPNDEYFDNLLEFERLSLTDDTYFPESIWKEREVTDYTILNLDSGGQYLSLEMNGITNFRAGDVIKIDFIEEQSFIDEVYGAGSTWQGPITVGIISVTTNINDNHVITVDLVSSVNEQLAGSQATATLVYHRLVQYLGEINGISNVQEANKAYTEVFAHVPDHTGRTPDILFRTLEDVNYKSGLIFPIIPNQYQPEIIGAELFSSPIVSNPQNYPGGYYGDFDTEDFTYEVQNGDSIRRSGDFYGINGDINTPIVNGSTVDGIIIDFNTDHYVKMNIEYNNISNFDQFNALEVNNQPPSDFEFNAILWYYTVEDATGNRKTNLYGVSFLDNPENNPNNDEVGVRFPPYKKFVTNGNQDGTAYQFGLNLNFNIVNDNPVEAYNPQAVNSLFSMSLFNEAMKRLSSINDSFLNIISEHSSMKEQITNMKQLLYTQTDFAVIKARIDNLDRLLNLYSTNQIVSSDSIEVSINDLNDFASISLKNVEPNFSSISSYNTSLMYLGNQVITESININSNKDFVLNIINNDEVSVELMNNDNLKLLFTQDLNYRQSVEIRISGSDLASENKKLDILINSVNPLGLASTGTNKIETLLISDIDLPVFYNKSLSIQNSAKNWKEFNFNIDFDKLIDVRTNNLLQLSLKENAYIINNSIKPGDCVVLNNLFIGTSSVYDFSGQYFITSVGATNSQIVLDVSTNLNFVDYISGSIPYKIHTATSTRLSNNPYLSINKGKTIKITRISESDNVSISDKYMIDVRDTQY
jgi:hypothetical protein